MTPSPSLLVVTTQDQRLFDLHSSHHRHHTSLLTISGISECEPHTELESEIILFLFSHVFDCLHGMLVLMGQPWSYWAHDGPMSSWRDSSRDCGREQWHVQLLGFDGGIPRADCKQNKNGIFSTAFMALVLITKVVVVVLDRPSEPFSIRWRLASTVDHVARTWMIRLYGLPHK